MRSFLIGGGISIWSFLKARARWKSVNGKDMPIPICAKSSIAFLPVALVTKRFDWVFLFCTSVWNHTGHCSKLVCMTDKILAHVVPVLTLSSTCWHPIGISGLCYSGVMFYVNTRNKENLENNVYHASIHIIGSSCAIISWLNM
jgi:hypothetical protein